MLSMNNGFAEQNHIVEDEQKKIRDGIMGEDQELSEEGESQINEDEKDVNDKGMESLQVLTDAQVVIQSQHQQSQGPLVHWERFLPRRSLKVLLVENDDSTRHVVSALLRNCGYEATAVANGLQAWKLLQDLTNHIDLVLTEVAMPCLSGIGLLSNIMSHKTCRNIPVIMMSSHDSMNVVFRCLSKGAVDFLVKPIRKNELKILWQHVWRRCHSASGSGSESAVRIQKSLKSKGADESDNDTDSNDDDDIGSIGLNARDGSDNGSGTQSSWTKRAVEVDSPKPMLPWDQLADPPDSTFAQVIHSRSEACDNWVPLATTKKFGKQDDELDNFVMGKDLEIGVPRIPNLQHKDLSKEVLTNIAGNNGEKFREIKSEQDSGHLEKGQLELNSEKHNTELRNQGNDLKGVSTNITNPQIESEVVDISNSLSSNKKNEVIYETKEMPSLELVLKRLRDTGDAWASANDRNVLRHSDLSAFSRYNSASTAYQAPTGNVGSCSLLDKCSEAAKTESMQNLQSNSNSTPRNLCSNGSSNNNDVGTTTNNAFAKPLVIRDKPTPKSTVKCLHPSSAFQPVQNDQTLHAQPVIQAAGPRCGSSNMLSTPMEGNAGNYSMNGSNGQNESCIALNPRGINLESNSGAAGKDENPGTGDESGSRSGGGQNCFALREAALNKFRQKRKERCFEKKVRYQSRKKLAEHRPRVRGQFVRQVPFEHKDEDAQS
ncbi:two-component response regulator-like PRR37 isoform X2 [Populus trichocarpa]|uniref:two-component response regulator-like PRR37 isoform X2 n=1 Tax=Populus trichocarpa TaxID=3694 RepID=UPI0022792400|nr:two-component response regulator-like PRR37 isoform X2 [Populus trichocarpa]